MPRIVLSLLAEDRPGIVKELSDIAVAHGANWLESRMAQLAGQFAGLVALDAPPERVDALIAALRGFGGEAGHVLVRQGSGDGEPENARPIEITLDGADHPGIVHQLSELLAGQAINIIELETDQHAASMSGQQIFTARIQALAPPGADRQGLGEALDALAHEMTVEIRVQWPQAQAGTA